MDSIASKYEGISVVSNDEMAAAEALLDLCQDLQGAADAHVNLACRTLAIEHLPAPRTLS